MKSRICAAFLLLVWGWSEMRAQSAYELVPAASNIVITGTSSLHDWEMDVKDPQGTAVFLVGNQSLEDIQSATLRIRSGNIESGNSIMDKKTYKALRTDRYPDIRFTVSGLNHLVPEGNRFHARLEGKVMISGISRTVNVPVEGLVSGNIITITGTKQLSMADFHIDPPTAMMGSLKTGDEVEIHFKTDWKLKGSSTATL